jgi:hypothetical protein
MSDITQDNPFAQAETWSVGGDFLPRGDHAVEVTSAELGRSTNNYPQVLIQVGNEQGSIKDWIVVIPSTLGKVVQLTEALGIGRPQPGQFKQVNGEILFEDAYVQSWVGKKVGVRVGARNNDQSKDEVKGYFPVDRVKATPASDATSEADSALFQHEQPHKPQNAVDDDIPF